MYAAKARQQGRSIKQIIITINNKLTYWFYVKNTKVMIVSKLQGIQGQNNRCATIMIQNFHTGLFMRVSKDD